MASRSFPFTNNGEAGDAWQRVFATRVEAENYLTARGFSLGRMQGPALRGILFGDYDIQKWRNLRREDIAALHGTMSGSRISDRYVVTIYSRAPAEAHAAIRTENVPESGLGESAAA